MLLMFSITGKSQSSYSGYLGTFPITLVMYHYGDGDSRAYYAYDKFDTPITINGTLKNNVITTRFILYVISLVGDKIIFI